MTPKETIFALGDDALGVRLASKSRRNALAHHLRESGQWREVIPGIDGLSVQYDPYLISVEDAHSLLKATLLTEVPPFEKALNELVIPVCYAPEYALDMPHISALTGLSAEDIIERHTHAPHNVDMIGFTPGFTYLEGGDPTLDVPRLETPRKYLPAGSVGLAGGLCGLYALPGPGGWPIIGRTPISLFDTNLSDPFRLQAGQAIRFEAISDTRFKAWR